ncbi:MAG: hypothetical protein JWP08_1312 [Bryobacterales bacterium]|nr:hypothetical protein [Bryobacterales bacterium]
MRGNGNPIQVMAILEAQTVTGPAKNLLRFCQLAQSRPNADVRVSLLTYVRAGGNEHSLSNQVIDTVRAAGLEIDVVRERYPLDWRVIPQLQRLFRERSPDIIQSHSVKSHFLVALTKPREMHWVAYHHGYTDPDFKMRMYNQFDRWSLPRADRVVTVCEPFRDLLVRNGVSRERTRVVSNAVSVTENASVEDVSSLRAKWNLPEHARIILAVGRLSNEKGHHDLLAAAASFQRRYPDLHLVIVGDGPERQRCQQQAERAGMAGRVRFTGYQRNTFDYYKLADLFVLPSLSEGSPNVLLEAMVARVPVIATAVGGVPELVKNGRSAILVKPGNPVELAQAISRMLDNPNLGATLRENAYREVLEQHTPEAHYVALLRLYQELAGRLAFAVAAR